MDLNKPRCTCDDEFGNADIVGLEDVMPDLYANLDFNEMNRLTDALNRFRDLEVAIESGELAPVVHGRWINDDDGYYRCSRCHQKAPMIPQYQDEPETELTKYCPKCAAIMDLEDKNER